MSPSRRSDTWARIPLLDPISPQALESSKHAENPAMPFYSWDSASTAIPVELSSLFDAAFGHAVQRKLIFEK
jgi:hypothetical protein